MALVTDVYCKECNQTKHEVTHYDNLCHDCRYKIANQARRTHLASLKGLSIEERLEKIEAYLYDLNIDSRLSRCESHHQTY